MYILLLRSFSVVEKRELTNIFSNSNFEGNRYSGILNHNLKYPTLYRDVKSSNNENGISLGWKVFENIFKNCEIYNNSYGLFIQGSFSDTKILESDVHSNSKIGVYIMAKNNFFRSTSKLLVKNSKLRYHKSNVHHAIEANNPVNESFHRNTFEDNAGGDISLLKGSSMQAEENIFLKTTQLSKQFRIECSSMNYLLFRNNTVKGGKGSFLHYRGSNGVVQIRDNSIENYEMINNILFIENGQVFIQDNVIRKNYIDTANYHFSPNLYPEYALTVIKISNPLIANVNKNILDNPTVCFEIVIKDDTNKPNNCTGNFWGKNVNVLNRIIGQQKLNGFSKLNIFPIYKNENFTDLSPDPNFFENHNIFYEEIRNDLSLKKGIYHLKTRMKIPKNITFTLYSGVILYVWPFAGLDIFGQLKILGQSSNDVMISTPPATVNSNLTIENNLVYYDYEGVNYPVCNSVTRVTLRSICLALGFSARYSVLNKRLTTKWSIMLTCTDHNIKICEKKLNNYCKYQLDLRCFPIDWDNLYFSFDSRIQIKGVTISNFQNPIYIDNLNFNLTNVTLKSHSKKLIFMNYINPNRNYIWNNIKMEGMQSKVEINVRGSLKFSNSDFKNINIFAKMVLPTTLNGDKSYFSCQKNYFLKKGDEITWIFEGRSRYNYCFLQFSTEDNLNLEFFITDLPHWQNRVIYIQDYSGRKYFDGGYLNHIVDYNQANLSVSLRSSYPYSLANVMVIVRPIQINGI